MERASPAQQASRSKSYDLAKTMTALLAWFLRGIAFALGFVALHGAARRLAK